MKEKYCPKGKPAEGYLWGPVCWKWCEKDVINAAHLFPYRQAMHMDAIHGDNASEELFSHRNGLFLDHDIEGALDSGLIAIVPDIDLDPTDSQLPLDDEELRHNRVRDWSNRKIKDYKVIAIRRNIRNIRNISQSREAFQS
jgi:hypothetical protein